MDEEVYAAILARVERRERVVQCSRVLQTELEEAREALHQAEESLVVLRQLQAVAKHLNLRDTKVLTELETLETLRKQLATKLQVEKEEEIEAELEESDDGVTILEVRKAISAKLEAKPEVTKTEVQSKIEEFSDNDPLELEVLSSDEEAVDLKVLTSDEEQMEPGVLTSDEEPLELEVLTSDEEEDFPNCLEVAVKLQEAKIVEQLQQFPPMVDQLRSYLRVKKHFTVAELDGYLFAHQALTELEENEVIRAIEIGTAVGMTLPLNPRIEEALLKLQGTIEQFKHTLGKLPEQLRPVAQGFATYLSSRLENVAPASDSFIDVMRV